MSQRLLPHYIDPVKLVEQKSILSGCLKLDNMPRLLQCVVSADQDPEGLDSGTAEAGERNSITVELEFYRDEEGLKVMAGRVAGELGLVCQRCLGHKLFQFDVPIALAMVSNDKAAAELPGRYDPLLVNQGPVSLITLIEDEVLLALPAVAYHDEGECRLFEFENGKDEQAQAKTKSPKPFDILAELKK